MPFSSGQIDQSTFCEKEKTFPIREGVLLHKRSYPLLLHCKALQDGDIDLCIEVPTIGHNRSVFHRQHVISIDDIQPPGYCDEDVTYPGCLEQGHDPVAIHHRFQSRNGLNLAYYDMGAEPLCSHRYPAATPAVSTDHHLLTCPEDIGRSGDAVYGTLPGAITIVEEMLCLSVVHCNNGVF